MPRQNIAVVNGNLFSVSTQGSTDNVVVRQYARDARKPNGVALVWEMTATGSVIDDRVLGQPIVICHQGHLLVAQFVIQHAQQVQFLVIDLAQRQYFVFHDTNRHFIRDRAIVEGVLCNLSPDHHLMILRLPRSVMARPHKSSLTLTAKKTDPHQAISVGNQVIGTERFRLQDRRFCMFAFDPRFPRRLVCVNLNEYCTKCLVLCRDHDKQTNNHRAKSVALGQLCVSYAPSGNDGRFSSTASSTQLSGGQLPSTQLSGGCTRADCDNKKQSEGDSGDSDSESEDDSFDPPLAFHLLSCNMEYCRMGDVIAVCCCIIDSLENYYLRVFLLDADTYSCIKQISEPVGKCDKLSEDPFQISFSPCDSQVHVEVPVRGDACACHVTLCKVDIPRKLSLRARCRAAVLQNVTPGGDVKSLPLPTALIEYLQFSNHRYRASC